MLKKLNVTMGQNHGWYCTDDDCLQFQRKEAEKVFDMIQLIWLDTTKRDTGYPDREYIVVAARIEVDDDQIEDYIAGFYESTKAMMETYSSSIEDLYGIIAECAFENISGESGYDFVSKMLTKVEAEEMIMTYVETCNGTLSNRVCRRCGHPVFESFLRHTENGYLYQCFHCDEDLYGFETIGKEK